MFQLCLDIQEEVSATPPDFEEAKIRADSLKNRLQALGNLKERLDGAASDENKDDMFTVSFTLTRAVDDVLSNA